MRIQATLTVNEAKRIIAKGIANHPVVEKAKESGRIFFKGGTTASAVCEELIGKPLRLSGRIVPQGTKMPKNYSTKFHCALIEQGNFVDLDESLEQVIENLDAHDVAIIGANAIDVYGNAALMYGAALGGKPGRVLSGVLAEITNVFIVAGLEKLVPGSLTAIIPKAGRKNIDVSFGMAVGLTPLSGTIITEKDAIPLLADVSCTVIGRGGIFGAEGATTMIIEGRKEEAERILDIISSIKGADVSGMEESLPTCVFPTEYCKYHLSCVYRKKSTRD
jgi:hypothetical protein